MNIDSEILNILPSLLTKVFIASLCGLIIGIDRELKNKVAGIRTFLLICVGCCIYTSLSFLISQSHSVDPTRIIAQIVTGIGFLGAGVIFKNEDKVVGVTTAAFIWVVSAIGVLVGLGAIVTPIVLTLGLVVVSLALEKIEQQIKKRKSNAS